jgi:hypothetical protein
VIGSVQFTSEYERKRNGEHNDVVVFSVSVLPVTATAMIIQVLIRTSATQRSAVIVKVGDKTITGIKPLKPFAGAFGLLLTDL